MENTRIRIPLTQRAQQQVAFTLEAQRLAKQTGEHRLVADTRQPTSQYLLTPASPAPKTTKS